MWPADRGKTVDVEHLASRIVRAPGIEGVTFLGGEPFEQADALAELASSVRAAGLSVMAFSGYEYDELLSSPRADWRRLLGVTDLLVDGPFDQQRLDRHRPWVGSTNQNFRFLTPRYRNLESELRSIPDRVEIRIGPDGVFFLNGMCSEQFLRTMRRDIGRTSPN